MNIIRLLLIGGLVYFAMQQKKEGTRNMVLIVTGLLAVCMLSKEGFTIGSTHSGGCVDPDEETSGTCHNALATATGGLVATLQNRTECIGDGDFGAGSPTDIGVCTPSGASPGELNTVRSACTGDGSTFTRNTWTATRTCGDPDSATGECGGGCVPAPGTVYALSEVFNHVTGTNTITVGENVYEYTGTDGFEITTLDGLRGAFTCNGEATTVKGTASVSDIDFNGSTKLDIENLLQCHAPPSVSPGVSPGVSPPSGTPSSGGPSSAPSPSPSSSFFDFNMPDWWPAWYVWLIIFIVVCCVVGYARSKRSSK